MRRPRRLWWSFLCDLRCPVRWLMRSVRIAICTSGEPVSVSWRRYSPIVAALSGIAVALPRISGVDGLWTRLAVASGAGTMVPARYRHDRARGPLARGEPQLPHRARRARVAVHRVRRAGRPARQHLQHPGRGPLRRRELAVAGPPPAGPAAGAGGAVGAGGGIR